MRVRFVALISAVLIGAFALVLPFFTTMPDRPLLESVAKCLAEKAKIQGVMPPSAGDTILSVLWSIGGFPLTAAGRWLGLFLLMVVVLGLITIIFEGLCWKFRSFRLPIRIGESLVFVVLVFAGIYLTILAQSLSPHDLRIIAPISLIKAAQTENASQVFYNLPTLPDALLFSPKWPIIPGSESQPAGQNPPSWRTLDHKRHFQAVLLTGSLQESQKLINYLLAAPGWQLALIDNHGLLFLPGTKENYEAPSPEKAAADFTHTGDKAVFLAQMAAPLNAVNQKNASKKYIEAALAMAPKNPDVLTRAAALSASNQQWHTALEYARGALELRPHFFHAEVIAALSLLEIGSQDKARDMIDAALEQSPDDLPAIYLLARITRTQRDLAGETTALEKLITLSDKYSLPTGQYQVLLGQTLALQGFAPRSLKAYQAALDSGQLEEKQLIQVKEAMATIREKAPQEWE